MTYDHPLRGTCNDESCPQRGVCHCECGQATAVAPKNHTAFQLSAGNPFIWRQGHAGRVVKHDYPRRGKWTKNSFPISALTREFNACLLRFPSQRAFADALGVTENWVSMVKKGRITHIKTPVAMRLMELVRGTRAQAETGLKSRKRSEERRKPPAKRCECGRRIVTRMGVIPFERCFECRDNKGGGEYHCPCGKAFSSDHGLYLHSLQVHGDKTQGKHSWAKRVSA